jgi:hypothetical protein
MGAIAFIETMDYTSLSNITQEEFESNVEAAIARLSAAPPDTPVLGQDSPRGAQPPRSPGAAAGSHDAAYAQEGSDGDQAKALPLTPMAMSIAEDTRAFFSRTGEVARAGLGASFVRPMGALGRLLSDGIDGVRTPNSNPGAAGSGGASPSGADSPGDGHSGHGHLASQGGTGRRLFAGLFGNDSEETPSRPTSGYGGANWTRAFRGPEHDEEPQTPAGDELRHGPFSTLAGGQGAPGAPSRRRAQPGFPGYIEPQRPAPARQSSFESYHDDDDDDGPMTGGSGARTPTSEDGEHGLGVPSAAAGRAPRAQRFASDFAPSFLAPTQPVRNVEPATPTPARPAQLPQDVAEESEEIQRVHLAAGIETVSCARPAWLAALTCDAAAEHLPERRASGCADGARGLVSRCGRGQTRQG